MTSRSWQCPPTHPQSSVINPLFNVHSETYPGNPNRSMEVIAVFNVNKEHANFNTQNWSMEAGLSVDWNKLIFHMWLSGQQ